MTYGSVSDLSEDAGSSEVINTMDAVFHFQ